MLLSETERLWDKRRQECGMINSFTLTQHLLSKQRSILGTPLAWLERQGEGEEDRSFSVHIKKKLD